MNSHLTPNPMPDVVPQTGPIGMPPQSRRWLADSGLRPLTLGGRTLLPGVQGGMVHGATDDLGYAAVEKVTTVHDLHATMLHQLGVRHDAFSYKFQGLDARLTGVEGAKVIKDILV